MSQKGKNRQLASEKSHSTESHGQEDQAQTEAAPQIPVLRTADILGYTVTAPEDASTPVLYSFVREFKRLHEKYKLGFPLTLSMPAWHAGLLRMTPPPPKKETA